MARRRGGVRYRTRTVVRRARRRSAAGGGMKPFIDGAMAGIAAEAGQKFIGAYGAPLGIGAVGFIRKNPTLKTIAGLQAGAMIGDMLPVIGGGGSALGGAY